jgi:hypothetical protein
VILNLLGTWPVNETLIEYLTALFKAQLMPLHIFVPAFLRANRQRRIEDLRTLDTLCQLTISMSREMPLSVLVSLVDPVDPVPSTVLDAFKLQRTAILSPYSALHDLQATSAEILLLMLQYMPSIAPQFVPADTVEARNIFCIHSSLQFLIMSKSRFSTI